MRRYYKCVNIDTRTSARADSSVMIIYTGGTIGMDVHAEKGVSAPFDFEHIMEKVPEIRRLDFGLTVLSLPNLMDSSDMKPAHWIELAQLIKRFYDDYSGFVVLHGTDTMAYTASALSFLLENLKKPVVLTGAQLPISASRTDARENLIASLEIAAARDSEGNSIVREVCIFFDDLLLRGNRSKKVQNLNFTAFASENHPPLAKAGIYIQYHHQSLWRPAEAGRFRIYEKLDDRVMLLKYTPGMRREYLESCFGADPLRAVVLETFGSGNVGSDGWLLDLIKNAVEGGGIILNISQSHGGRVLQDRYEHGRQLSDIGVISGGDMTTEAALTKIMFLLANIDSPALIKKNLRKSIRGEISV